MSKREEMGGLKRLRKYSRVRVILGCDSLLVEAMGFASQVRSVLCRLRRFLGELKNEVVIGCDA